MKSFKFYIARATIRYPAGKDFCSEIEFKQYLDSLANKYNTAVLNNDCDYDKIYSNFNLIKTPQVKVADKGKKTLVTNIYYFVECTYVKNKLQSHSILYTKYPKLIMSSCHHKFKPIARYI